MSDDAPAAAKRSRRKLLLSTTVLIIFAALLGTSGFFYYQYRRALDEPSAGQVLLERIGASVQLPNEAPILLTISDKSKLSNAVLASRVDNGDKLFVFSKAKRVIIYRPSVEKVTDMLSIENPGSVTAQQTPAAKQESRSRE